MAPTPENPDPHAEPPRDQADVDDPVAGVTDVQDTSAQDQRVQALLEHTIDVTVLADAVEQQEAADAADVLERLEEEEAVDVLEEMKDRPAAEALAEMEMPLAVGVLEDLVAEDSSYASRLVELMAPDDAADQLQALAEPVRNRLLAAMEREPAGELVQLTRYDKESAGGLMTTDFLALRG